MIKSDNGMVTIKGDGITLLAELCCVVSSLKDSGIPENAIVSCVSMGLAHAIKTEDEELAENYMRELMRRVKEKRDAKNDK